MSKRQKNIYKVRQRQSYYREVIAYGYDINDAIKAANASRSKDRVRSEPWARSDDPQEREPVTESYKMAPAIGEPWKTFENGSQVFVLNEKALIDLMIHDALDEDADDDAYAEDDDAYDTFVEAFNNKVEEVSKSMNRIPEMELINTDEGDSIDA